jgi:RNA polymerase sigma-70 factor (ECF subfamily)
LEDFLFREMVSDKSRADVFYQYRRRLFGIAYRMTGSRADAEDIVQEAYLRWHKTKTKEIETPEAWLVTVTTRISIDRLRILAKERETYIGPWLPEPLLTNKIYTPEERLEFASNLSLAFLALLERLSPAERAAFLLRDVFDVFLRGNRPHRREKRNGLPPDDSSRARPCAAREAAF